MRVRVSIVAAAILSLAAFTGCDSKKNGSQPQPPQAAMSSAAKGSPSPHAAVKPSPQDEADAAALKERVLEQVKARDFAAIYRGASAGFKSVGPEEQFVGLWRKQMQQTGAFKGMKEVSRTVRPADGFLVYVYRVDYEKAPKELRLTFGRSKKGNMELTGINHRDIR